MYRSGNHLTASSELPLLWLLVSKEKIPNSHQEKRFCIRIMFCECRQLLHMKAAGNEKGDVDK